MGWWQEAQRGAAREFGRRHYRLFAALAILRPLLPALAVLLGASVAAVVVWVLMRGPEPVIGTGWIRPALAIVAAVLVLVLVALVWGRWGRILTLYWPMTSGAAIAAAVVGLLAAGGAAAATWTWLPL